MIVTQGNGSSIVRLNRRCERSEDARWEVLFPVPPIPLRVGVHNALKLFCLHLASLPGYVSFHLIYPVSGGKQSLLRVPWLTVCAPTLDGIANLRNFLYQRVEQCTYICTPR